MDTNMNLKRHICLNAIRGMNSQFFSNCSDCGTK